MARYIDADELSFKMYIEAMTKNSDLQKWDSGCWIRYKLFEIVLEKIPTADVAPIIPAKIKDWRCTNCNIGLPVISVENHNGIVWQYTGEMKYCPNCGAKMEVNNES